MPPLQAVSPSCQWQSRLRDPAKGGVRQPRFAAAASSGAIGSAAGRQPPAPRSPKQRRLPPLPHVETRRPSAPRGPSPPPPAATEAEGRRRRPASAEGVLSPSMLVLQAARSPPAAEAAPTVVSPPAAAAPRERRGHARRPVAADRPAAHAAACEAGGGFAAVRDVALRVLSYLTPPDLGRCAQVSRLWGCRAAEDQLWLPWAEQADLLSALPHLTLPTNVGRLPLAARERYRELLRHYAEMFERRYLPLYRRRKCQPVQQRQQQRQPKWRKARNRELDQRLSATQHNLMRCRREQENQAARVREVRHGLEEAARLCQEMIAAPFPDFAGA
eukprot:TRINITY_DN12761_c0_g1_i1.p1 TRINITY_DN12761_c0_g1~~TRINITY_DN12761_c0_g1_i1.p1  ORF type:complete len:358 (+),score=111.46 TRINITY_DN12761_c0_g1_i1:82-1074(+)